MKKHRAFLQKWISFMLGIMALSLGMLAAVSTSAWYPRTSQQDQGKAFQKYLPGFPEPVQLLEIKTANQTIRFPDEILTLTAFAAKRGTFTKDDTWSLDSPSEVSLKQAPAFKIKDISGGRPYIEVQVADGDDWFKGATFYLKNNSDREIIYLGLDVDFPQTASTGNVISAQLGLGQWPGQTQIIREPILLKPGKEIPITIDDKRYATILRVIEKRQPTSTITRVMVRIGFVIFSDGFGWGAGNYYRQDPNKPDRFENIGIKPPNN